MINLSEFAESLKELMIGKEIDAAQLAKEICVHENSIYRYLAATFWPILDTVLKLADFFQCSVEYLLGRTEVNHVYTPKTLPLFGERLKYIFKYFQSNEYRLTRATKISRSLTHGWLYGKSVPKIENLAKIADYYGTTIDFIIGREN